MNYDERFKNRVKFMIRELPKIFTWETAELNGNIITFNECLINKSITLSENNRLRKGEYIKIIQIMLLAIPLFDRSKRVTILSINSRLTSDTVNNQDNDIYII